MSATESTQETGYPRSWKWGSDPDRIEGRYVETTEGPSRYGDVPIVVLELDSGEKVGVWLFNRAVRDRFAREVVRRASGDLHAGERIVVERLEERTSQSTGYPYRAFRVEFERSPVRSARQILGDATAAASAEQGADEEDDIPF